MANLATDKRAQSESVPAKDRAWQPVSLSSDTQTLSVTADARRHYDWGASP